MKESYNAQEVKPCPKCGMPPSSAPCYLYGCPREAKRSVPSVSLPAACAAVCRQCAAGDEPEYQDDPTPCYWHGNRECKASAIRLMGPRGNVGLFEAPK